MTGLTKFWYIRINGDISRIDEVPTLWREKVKAAIEENQSKQH